MPTCPEEIEKRDQLLAEKENLPTANLIPKPKGSAGDGFSLIQAMGLDEDTDLYDAVLVSNVLVITSRRTSSCQLASAKFARMQQVLDSTGAKISEARRQPYLLVHTNL